MLLIRQPVGSSLCGQTCVAMAAGVDLDTVLAIVGPAGDNGTHTKHLITALHALGVGCADRLKIISRSKPVLPSRAIIAIHGPHPVKSRRPWHWVLYWQGEILDPDGLWPSGYKSWRMTSFLELYE